VGQTWGTSMLKVPESRQRMVMMSSEIITRLSFLDRDPVYQHEKPYEIISGIAPSGWQSNCKFSSVANIAIKDCRKSRSSFTLDSCGFEYVDWPASSDFDFNVFQSQNRFDAAGLVERYLLETMALAQARFCAEKVICIDWRVRWHQSECC